MTTMQYAPPTQPRKSAGVGFLLGFLFGPFGMFYVSVTAGLVSVGIYIPFVLFTGGFGILGWFLFGFLAMALAQGKNNTADWEAQQQINWSALTDEQKLVKQQQILDEADAREAERARLKAENDSKTHWEKNKVGYIVFAGLIVGLPLFALLVSLI